MKIRQGFVSNSSSSSFCIYGAKIKNDVDVDVYDVAEKAGLECHYPEGWESYYVGMSWSLVGDDETGAQFKKRVETIVEKSFGLQNFDTFEETYYN
jgi:hypothetical protein